MPRQCLFFPFIRFKVNSSSVTQKLTMDRKPFVHLPSPFLYPHNNHTSSLQTLCYFSFFSVYPGPTEDPLLQGELVRPHPPKLHSAFHPKQSLNISRASLQNLQLKIIMRHWGLQYFHDIRENSDLTMGHPLLAAPLFCNCCRFRPSTLLCWSPSVLLFPFSAFVWVRNWSGRNVMPQRPDDTDGAPTRTRDNSKGTTVRGVGTFWLRRPSSKVDAAFAVAANVVSGQPQSFK